MSTHTPGPWRVSSRNTLHVMQTGSREALIKCQLPPGSTREVVHAEAEANARLIAAAPDLLAACEAVEAATHSGDYGPAFDAVRAALAKAQA